MMTVKRKTLIFVLISALFAAAMCLTAAAADASPVETVLVYAETQTGEQVLVSHMTIDELEQEIAGRKSKNFSILDRFVTPVHQEGTGFGLEEFISLAAEKSESETIRASGLAFDKNDSIAFWEIDQQGFDDMDDYTWSELCGTERYNFPRLYEYWNYKTQTYGNSSGTMNSEEAEKIIADGAERAEVMLAVSSYSQRYFQTEEKYLRYDYDMEHYFAGAGLLDTARSLRLIIPMSMSELHSRSSSGSGGRFWICCVLVRDAGTSVFAQGMVSAPTASMTEDDTSYYVHFECATPGAVILYSDNPEYTPTKLFTGEAVKLSKADYPGGSVSISCRAVKDGCTDAGISVLSLSSSGRENRIEFSDVREGAWYYRYVTSLASGGVINGMTPDKFVPDGEVTWGQTLKLTMLACGLGEQPKSGEHWASGYLDYAVSSGFTSYAGSLDAPITRLELSRLIAAMLGLKEIDIISPFSDTDDGSVLALYEKGIINGMGDGTFGASSSLTRAQVSKIIWSVGRL